MYSKCPWFLTQNKHKIKKKNSPPQAVNGRHTDYLGRLGCFHRKCQTLAIGGFIKCQEEEVLTPFHGYVGLGRERRTLSSGLFRDYPSNWEIWASWHVWGYTQLPWAETVPDWHWITSPEKVFVSCCGLSLAMVALQLLPRVSKCDAVKEV